MNEELHIEKAARLADKPAAENLATDRARKFVADALASQEAKKPVRNNIFQLRPAYVWGGLTMAVAACVAIAVVLFRSGSGGSDDMGIPGILFENQVIHADSETLDSLATQTSDTLTVETIIEPEE